jgi:hypothetical protein
LLFLAILGTLASDAAINCGCSYAGISIEWGYVILGIVLQLVGLASLAHLFVSNTADLFPDYYCRYGFLRSKWY